MPSLEREQHTQTLVGDGCIEMSIMLPMSCCICKLWCLSLEDCERVALLHWFRDYVKLDKLSDPSIGHNLYSNAACGIVHSQPPQHILC